MAKIETTETKLDSLFAGTEVSPMTAGVTIASGAGKLVRGTVLGKVSASGKYVAVDNTKSDGSEVAQFILAENVDATTADVSAVVYKTGVFRASSLVFGGNDSLTNHRDELRLRSLHTKEEY